MLNAEGIARAVLDQPGATLDDVVPLLVRIADALEAQVRPSACDEPHKTGAKCVLDDRHIGHHTSGDGRLHWLDED